MESNLCNNTPEGFIKTFQYLKNIKPTTKVGFIFSAQNWIRTSTSLRTLRPEHSASTNFAIWAFLKPITLFYIQGVKNKLFSYFIQICYW